MKTANTEGFVYALCHNCGKTNRVAISRATESDAHCGKCGALLLSNEIKQEAPCDNERAKKSGGIGFFQSLGIATLALIAFRYGIELIADPDYKKYCIYSSIAIAALSATIRYLLIKAALLLVLMCAMYVVAFNWKGIANKRITVADVVTQTLNMASGYGPIKNLKNDFQVARYSKYVNAVDVRSDGINILASRIIADCDVNELGCQARTIARFVSNEIKYVADPTTGGDYVKPPLQTLTAKSGDCDDQTVLASSLLGTIGIKTLFVFEKRHVYPRACFESKIPLAYLDGNQYFKYENLYCYDLEPTAKGSGLGVRHEVAEIIKVIDVQTKLLVR